MPQVPKRSQLDNVDLGRAVARRRVVVIPHGGARQLHVKLPDELAPVESGFFLGDIAGGHVLLKTALFVAKFTYLDSRFYCEARRSGRKFMAADELTK